MIMIYFFFFLHICFFFFCFFHQTIILDYASTNVDKPASLRSKAKAEFLENLNAKLAKQSLSGRAFAVRNLINSKALVSKLIVSVFLYVSLESQNTICFVLIYLQM